ncbi:oxidoreductase [Aureococcus anophagefferens]|nr:oxidoreductase [Aureococcus anophagefferens]
MRSSSMYLAVLVCGVADAFVAPRPAPVAQVLRRSSSEESAREEIALRNESSDSLPPVSSSYQPVAAPSQLALAGLVAERCLGFAADRLGGANYGGAGGAGAASSCSGAAGAPRRSLLHRRVRGPCDVVVCATGATTNTFGVPGVREHCLFLKQIADADALRQGLGNCFERANLPALSGAGGARSPSPSSAGPTGVEFCGELLDFLESEALAFYPKLVGEASVTLLEATTAVLGAFDASLRDVAVGELEKSRNGGGIKGVDIRLGAAVTEVNGTHVLLGGDDPLPYGLCVWAAGGRRRRHGHAQGPGRRRRPGDAQAWARGRFGVDAWLRVLGAPPGEVFAIGDCAAGVVDFAAETKATLPRRPRSRPSRASTSRGC